MSKCANEKCNNNFDDTMHSIFISCDGDFVCCHECLNEYKKQIDYFYKTVKSEDDLCEWLNK